MEYDDSPAANIRINTEKGIIEVNIDTKIYPPDSVYSASYVFLDRAYVLLKGDPKKEITAEIKPKSKTKNKEDLEKLGLDFNSQLLNYLTYKQYSDRNIDVKRVLMHEIFGSLAVAGGYSKEGAVQKSRDNITENENYKSMEIDDPEGILVPWEEKYGNKEEKKIKVDKGGGSEKKSKER